MRDTLSGGRQAIGLLLAFAFAVISSLGIYFWYITERMPFLASADSFRSWYFGEVGALVACVIAAAAVSIPLGLMASTGREWGDALRASNGWPISAVLLYLLMPTAIVGSLPIPNGIVAPAHLQRLFHAIGDAPSDDRLIVLLIALVPLLAFPAAVVVHFAFRKVATRAFIFLFFWIAALMACLLWSGFIPYYE